MDIRYANGPVILVKLAYFLQQHAKENISLTAISEVGLSAQSRNKWLGTSPDAVFHAF